MKATINLPFFPGFYNSLYDAQEEASYYINERAEEEGVDPDDIEVDYMGLEQEIAEEFVDAFLKHAPSCVKDVTLKGIDRPKYYNFRNDDIEAEITIDEDYDILGYIHSHALPLSRYLKDHYSSRDGFMSFIETDIKDFKDVIADPESRHWEAHVEVLLEYMMLEKYEDKKQGWHDVELCLYYEVAENVCIDNYLKIPASE